VILDGAVRPGQIVSFTLHDGPSCLEYIDRHSPRETLVGLVCDEKDPQEASVYAGLCPVGTVVEIGDAAA
jgi:hypothetical protein